MSFSFGGPAGNGPAPPPPTGGFGFGQTTTHPSPAVHAPAPSFSFASNAAPSNTPAFGAPAASTAGTFSSSLGTSQQQQPPPQTTNYVVGSDFETTFPGKTLASKLMAVLSDNFSSVHVQQELFDLLPECQDWLLNVHVPVMIPPNQAMRQQMEQQQHVQLGSNGQVAPLNKKLLQQIKSLSDDLHISEHDAIALLEHAGIDHVRHELPGPFVVPVSEKAAPLIDNVPWAARELYFYNRMVQFKCLLQLWQWRAGAVVADPYHCERILKATDVLLQKGLVTKLLDFVQNATTRIGEWMAEVAKMEAEEEASVAMLNKNPTIRKGKNFAKLHLQQMVQERQCVIECLFFIAYHTQMTCQEVVDIVDLIGQMTNSGGPTGGLPILDPFNDVPDVHQPGIPHPSSPWGTTTTVMKKREEWENEWIQQAWTSGRAPLSRCVAILAMTVVAALDTKTLLMDRNTHGPNAFGVGNALLPSESSSLDAIHALNQRFCQDAQENWERKDILGLLMLAHAMLLRSCPAVLSSPRAARHSSPLSGMTDLKKFWRECIDAPRSFKSITYARLSLLPALHVPLSPWSSSSCDVSEFLLSTLSDFAAHYLDTLSVSGGWPISREKWMQEAKEDLKIRQAHEEQQRQFAYQFNTSWGASQQSSLNASSDSIDLMQRPDCMDDLIAFASAVCSLEPHFAMKFWSVEESDGDAKYELAQSRTLRDLRDQQSGDDSLRASYVSFLAGLSIASGYDGLLDGAATVYDMLSDEVSQNPDDTMTWTAVVQILKWYATQLGSETSSNTQSGTSRTKSRSGTSYYYDDVNTRPMYEQATPTVTSAKDRELDEGNIYFLLANLSLVSNVVARNPVARLRMLQITTPSYSSDGGEVVKQDSTLQVMFDLLIKAVTPEVRGKIFSTISELINFEGLDAESSERMHAYVRECWKLVEEYQILPIYLLEQYPSLSPSEISEIPHFSFPSHSMSLVGSSQRKSWLPADPRYSILYEMEHVEAATGVYPSTEGFLAMLKALVKSGICPNDLGSVWRSRTGCTPYIEYVIEFILPRLTQTFQGFPLIPFRCCHDKLSIAVLACEIVKEALSNYIISDQMGNPYEYCMSKARAVLGINNLASSVVNQPKLIDIPFDYLQDFGLPSNTTVNSAEGSTGTGQLNNSKTEQGVPASEFTETSKPGFPTTKSIGLSVLSSILSLTDATLFETLVLLSRDLAKNCPGCTTPDKFSVAASLYVATPPSFLSSKDGSKALGSPFSAYKSLEALRPSLSSPTVLGTSRAKQRNELAIMQILCAALAREDALMTLNEAARRKISVVPILGFEANGQRYSKLKERELHLTQLSKHIDSVDVRSSFVLDLIALSSATGLVEESFVQRASAATALIFYIHGSLGSWRNSDLLVRRRDGRNRLLARAFASQLVCSSELLPNEAACELIAAVLGALVSDLRKQGQSTNAALVRVLLGLPDDTESDLSIFDRSSYRGYQDCFDAILRVLERQCFERDVEYFFLGSMCYEIMYRLCSLDGSSFNQVTASYAAKRLRNADFWPHNLKIGLLRAEEVGCLNEPQSLHRFHAFSWIIKGSSAEMGLLCGSGNPLNGNIIASRNIDQYSKFMHFVFDIDFFLQIIDILPLEKTPLDHSLSAPSEAIIRSSKVMIKGSPDVVDGYDLIDGRKLCRSVSVSTCCEEGASLCRWSEEWNLHVMKECASAHMGNALHMLLGCASISLKNGIHPSYQKPSWLQLLTAMLDRMLVNSSQNGISFDSVFYTTATRNLALAVFMASELVISSDENDFPAIACTCKLISRLIARSDEDRGSGLGRGRKAERTAILANSLALLLGILPANQMTGDDIEDFRNAATVLAGLAAERPSDMLSPKCLASRACLMQIFRLLTEDQNFCRVVLTDGSVSHAGGLVVDELIDPIRTLDASIAPLLLVIANTRGGSDLLIQRGILDALLCAAQKYSAEESTFLASASTAVAYQSKEIVTPGFFADHVRLMSALITAQQNDDLGLNPAFKSSDRISAIMHSYQPLIGRLISSFPVDGDKLRLVIQCIALIRVTTTRTTSINARSLAPKQNVRYAIESKIIELTMHMAENPVPASLRRPLPMILEPHEDSTAASFIASKSVSRTWWDPLDVPGSNIVKLCNLATLGVRTIKDGLLILRHSHILVRAVMIRSLSRAICRCSEAARWAEFKAALSSTDEAFALRSALLELVEDLMALALNRVRQLKAEQMFDNADAQILSAALDHLALDVKQGKFSTEFPVDENVEDLTLDLAKALRQEIGVYR